MKKNMQGRTAQLMGETAELLASLCFESCPYRAPPWVKSLRRATHEEDSRGIDLIAEIDTGSVPVQIKSSWRRAREFERTHPDIPVLVVHPEDSEDFVRKKLLAVLRKERAKALPGYDPSKDKGIPPRPAERKTLGASLGERLKLASSS